MTRFYIEAHRPLNGGQILGNGQGQAVILDAKRPTWTQAWRRLVAASKDARQYPAVGHWRLVRESGETLAYLPNWTDKHAIHPPA